MSGPRDTDRRPERRPERTDRLGDVLEVVGTTIIGVGLYLLIYGSLAAAVYQTGVVILGVLGLLPT